MKNLLFILITFAAFTVSVAAQDSVAACRKALQDNDFDLAITKCNEAEQTDPQTGLAGKANAYAAKEMWDDAISASNAIIEKFPKPPDGLVMRARVYLERGKEGDYQKAFQDLNTASRFNPAYEQMLRPLLVFAGDMISIERWNATLAAMKPYEREQAIKGDSSQLLESSRLLAEVSSIQFEKENASLASLAKGEKLSQQELNAFNVRILEKLNQAVDAYRYNDHAYYIRAKLYHKDLKRPDMAVMDFRRAMAIKPDYIYYYEDRGKMYQDNKKYEKALLDFNKVIDLKPDDNTGYYDRAQLYEDMKKYDLELADIAKILEIDPSLGHLMRGHFYKGRKEYDKALGDINAYLKLKPNEAFTLIERCRIYNLKMQYALALPDCTAALKTHADIAYFSALIERSITYTGLKNYPLAFADLDAAAKAKFLSKTTISAGRGKVYLAQGNRPEAIKQFQQALAEDPMNEEAKKQLAALGIN